MSGGSEAFFVGMVVLAGTLLLAAAGWLIWRIERQGEDNALRIARMIADVHAVLRIMKFGAEVLTQHVQSQRDARKQGAEAEFNARQLEQMAQLLERTTPKLLSAKAPSEHAADAQAAELRRVLTQKGRLEGEVELLRENCNSQLKMLTEQRRDNQVTMNALSNSSALREVNEQLIGELRDVRQRNQELAADLNPIMTELKIVREQLAVLMQSSSGEGADLSQAMADAADRASAIHRERVSELEAELRRKTDETMRVQDELSRTLREKSFIEEQYLIVAEEAEEKLEA